MVSPGDLGQLIKPFVFLDEASIDAAPSGNSKLGWHPHSGIATLTLMLEGSVSYADSTGAKGVLSEGAVEWFQAGGGAWHAGAPMGPAKVYQLWVALPPALETAPATSRYLGPENFPRRGPVRVILGEWNGTTSPIPAPAPITYLDVVLEAGEVWEFVPPRGHDVAWIAVHSGQLDVPERVGAGELAVFEQGEMPIVFHAQDHVRLVLGSAVKHPHELVLGYYSVHSSTEALEIGERTYHEMGEALKREGRL
nr:pirin family protein [Bradyrhizobium oropedii]